jgi:hypothetical protein
MTIVLPLTEDADTLRRAVCQQWHDLPSDLLAAMDKAGRNAAGVLDAVRARDEVEIEWGGERG